MSNFFSAGAIGRDKDFGKSTGNSSVNFSFGLNTANFVSLSYNPNYKKRDGGTTGIFRAVFEIGGTQFRKDVYNPTNQMVYYEGKKVLPTDINYGDALDHNLSMVTLEIEDIILSAGVDEDRIKKALAANPATNLSEWILALFTVVPKELIKDPEDESKHEKTDILVDLFLEYQPTLKSGASRTYLQVPTTIGYGRYVCSPVVCEGEWKAEYEWSIITPDNKEINNKGLRYVDNNGNEHPFTRNDYYMNTKRTAVQKEEDDNKPTTSQSSSEVF